MKHFLGFIIIILISGCSGLVNSELNYTEPTVPKEPITTSKTVDKDFNSAWTELVAAVSLHHLVINNLEKDSGLINLTLNSDNPSKYINCGEWRGYFKNLSGERQYYFKGEIGGRFTELDEIMALTTTRSTKFSGGVNIFLQTVADNKTKITVNAIYLLSGTDRTTSMSPEYVHYEPTVETWSVTVSSNEMGESNMNETQCISTGYLETLILDYVK